MTDTIKTNLETSLGLTICDAGQDTSEITQRVLVNGIAWNKLPKTPNLTPHLFKHDADNDGYAEECIAILPTDCLKDKNYDVTEYLKANVFKDNGALTVNPNAEFAIALIPLGINLPADESMISALIDGRSRQKNSSCSFFMNEFVWIPVPIQFEDRIPDDEDSHQTPTLAHDYCGGNFTTRPANSHQPICSTPICPT
jgi:hypothetical protein